MSPHPGGLPGDLLHVEELTDVPERWQVRSSRPVLVTGRVIDVRQDDVVSPSGGKPFVREVVVHPGAVGVVALDDDDRMLLVRQYRHPVGQRLLEPPAGLLDVEAEEPLEAARRELYEEAHLVAAEWRVLVDSFSSPGMTTEAVRVYLARGLRAAADRERFAGVHEEADMTTGWAPLDAVVEAIVQGRLHNPLLLMGALTCWAVRQHGWVGRLRPADSGWPSRR